MVSGIYKIKSPSNKVYIGQSINIEKRKRIYKYYDSYVNSHGPKIHNSLNKYGFENHIFEVIEECSIEDLDSRETYWKMYYLEKVSNDWSKVLFCGLYDNGGGPKSEETKRRISEAKKGTKGRPKGIKMPKEYGDSIRSEERNIKIGLGNIGKLRPQVGDALRGIPLTEQHKMKISISSKNKTRNRKPIIQYDLKGNFIKRWESGTEAANTLGIIQACVS